MSHHPTPRRRRRLSPCGEPLQAVTVSLPADVAASIEQLGEGSPSAGLHELLRRYKRIPATLREQLLATYRQQQDAPQADKDGE
ncbi:MAG TPA: hypothetical protein VF916_09415 [Ktedonobacterales bacterium]